MSKGTPSMGKRHTKNHLLCPRCGNMAYHKQKRQCASCAFPQAKRRTPGSIKAKRRGQFGCGRMRYMKIERKRAAAGHPENPLLAPLRQKINH